MFCHILISYGTVRHHPYPLALFGISASDANLNGVSKNHMNQFKRIYDYNKVEQGPWLQRTVHVKINIS